MSIVTHQQLKHIICNFLAGNGTDYFPILDITDAEYARAACNILTDAFHKWDQVSDSNSKSYEVDAQEEIIVQCSEMLAPYII